jgi:5-methylcytosine-specific restriction enzyme subunit McrC
MRARHLTAIEHESLPIGEGGVTFTEAEYLTLLGERLPGLTLRGLTSIRLSQYCGAINLGERTLEILPKIDDTTVPERGRGVLLRLLRESEELPSIALTGASQQLRRSSLLEVFIAAFFESVFEIVRGGLRRQYREREDDLPVVRGRILLSRQLGVGMNRTDQVACCFDELTIDNEWNRSVKGGIQAVRPWIQSFALAHRWRELMAVFQDVEASADLEALDRLVFDRQAIRYRAALDWVRWILRLLSPSGEAGAETAPGLLFDMNVLFERAVASLLRRRIQAPIDLQSGDRYLARVSGASKQMLRLRPDIVIRRKNAVLVADTKWKRLQCSNDGFLMPERSDVYQMLAYASTYGCDDLVLIYPWHVGLAGSRETRLQLPKLGDHAPVLTLACIDVGDDSLEFLRGGSQLFGNATTV